MKRMLELWKRLSIVLQWSTPDELLDVAGTLADPRPVRRPRRVHSTRWSRRHPGPSGQVWGRWAGGGR